MMGRQSRQIAMIPSYNFSSLARRTSNVSINAKLDEAKSFLITSVTKPRFAVGIEYRVSRLRNAFTCIYRTISSWDNLKSTVRHSLFLKFMYLLTSLRSVRYNTGASSAFSSE